MVLGEQSPSQQQQHMTAASPEQTSRASRDMTGSAGSAATASCSLGPPAREHAFITGRRAPCHGIIHYLYEGSSSQNNTQAWLLGRMLQKTQTGSENVTVPAPAAAAPGQLHARSCAPVSAQRVGPGQSRRNRV